MISANVSKKEYRYAPGNKRKAEKALREVLTEYEQQHITVYKKDVLFCEYVKVWLEEARETLQPNSYEAYVSTIDNHIYPYFKDKGVYLADLMFSDVKSYYAFKSKLLSGNTLKKHHSIIRQTLRKAVQDGLIVNNPAAEITLLKTKSTSENS